HRAQGKVQVVDRHRHAAGALRAAKTRGHVGDLHARVAVGAHREEIIDACGKFGGGRRGQAGTSTTVAVTNAVRNTILRAAQAGCDPRRPPRRSPMTGPAAAGHAARPLTPAQRSWLSLLPRRLYRLAARSLSRSCWQATHKRTPGTAARRAAGIGASHSSQWVRP